VVLQQSDEAFNIGIAWRWEVKKLALCTTIAKATLGNGSRQQKGIIGGFPWQKSTLQILEALCRRPELFKLGIVASFRVLVDI